MSDLVYPSTDDMLAVRTHVKNLYRALRARDIPYLERYHAGDHADKDIMALVHMLRTTYPARAHISTWDHALGVLREKLTAGGYHQTVVAEMLNGLVPVENDSTEKAC